jgi:hypothetical protein
VLAVQNETIKVSGSKNLGMPLIILAVITEDGSVNEQIILYKPQS